MTFLKRVFTFLIVLALLAAAATVVLRKFFPPARITAIVQGKIRQRLNREVDLTGIHLRLSGLMVDEVQLSEIPSFKAGTFLKAYQVRLTWELLPLLRSINWHTFVPSDIQGHLVIRQVESPFYRAENLQFVWNLTGVDPTWTHLTGSLRVGQGLGAFYDLHKLAASGKGAALFTLPLQALQSLNKLGIVVSGLPDLTHGDLKRIDGDYRFLNGVMTIKAFQVVGKDFTLHASGTMNLASQQLALELHLQSPPSSSLGGLEFTVGVTGTPDHPKYDLRSLKKAAFKATIQGLMQNPAVRQGLSKKLQKIFH